MKPPPPLRILLDEGAPADVGLPFAERGHGVIHHADALPPGAKDPLVAKAAMVNKAALVATDRDFRQMVRRFGSPTAEPRFAGLHLIFFACGGVLAPKRAAHFMTLIEHEWHAAHQKSARIMFMEIHDHRVHIHR